METSGPTALTVPSVRSPTGEGVVARTALDRRIQVLTEVAGEFGVGVPLVELTELLPSTSPTRPEHLEAYLVGRPDLAQVVDRTAYLPPAGTAADPARLRRGAEYFARAEALWDGPLRWLQPTIRCIGVTGSVAYGAPTASDDLDFFVITRAGALPWFLAGTYLMLLLVRLGRANFRDPTPCFNYVIDERRVAREFAPGQGFMFAREALSARMVRGEDYYRTLLAQFPWMGVEIPRLYAARVAGGGDTRPRPASLLTRLGSALAFVPLATYLRCGGLIRNAQYRRDHREPYLHRTLVAPGRIATLSRRYELLRARYEGTGADRPTDGLPGLAANGEPAVPDGLSTDRDLVWLRPRGESPVPLRYWTDGPFIYLIAAGTDRRWRVAVLRQGGCAVQGPDGVVRDCAAAAATDPAEATRAREGVRRKYGDEVWRRHFRPTDRVIRLDPGRPARPPSAHELIRWEFDAVAPTYAHGVESSPLNRYLKLRTASWLVAALDGVDPLLEIGPGTGFETLPLLAAGHHVLAVDISEPMLVELRERARAAGVADHLHTRVAALSELGPALEEVPVGAFGGVYSTFGAFNLEENVAACAVALGRVIRPGGSLIFTSLNYPGAAPAAWEMLLGHPREAMARLSRTMKGSPARNSLDLYLRNPGFWDRTLAPSFERRHVRPVSVLTPPFDAPTLVRALGPRGRRTARSLDATLSRSALLSPLAEWVLLTYQRRSEKDATAPERSGGSPTSP